jgi:pimeloyl-ACP methyl ester carboxylesterase
MLMQYGGYPAFDIMYDTGGHLVDPTAQDEAVTYFGKGDGKSLTDIIVVSHGWNNDIADARVLYHDFFNAFAPVAQKLFGTTRRYGVVGLFWPSKKFADSSLIPGGAAGLSDPAALQVSAQLDQFAEMFGSDPQSATKIAHLRSLVPLLNVSPNAQDDYVSTLVSLIPNPRYEKDEGLDEARTYLETAAGRDILKRLSTPTVPVAVPIPGSGGAAGLGSVLGGITSAAASLGDLLTYYTMKDRAGIVGRTGAVATIRAVRAGRAGGSTLKIHLVGHSFGGRLVTSAANSLNGNAPGATIEFVDSMTLLEAAYSHNGLAKDWDPTLPNPDGAFRSVVTNVKVKGPIIISHSSHDFPVGVAYPLASRLMNQVASALIGGPNDKYGGMGRNGAQHTPEALPDVALAETYDKSAYPKAPDKPCWILNVRGDGPPPAPTITSHGDVAKPELAFVMCNYI